jgi:hypothetical protein
MAAPKFAPAGARESQHYESPDVVPPAWLPDRPGAVDGLQPTGPLLGDQGPDQGYALTLARRMTPRIELQGRERLDDAIRGCLGIALRRASLFGRAPVVYDVELAFTVWGFFDERPPDELIERRPQLFEGVGNVNHHYAEARRIADLVPEATLRMTHQQAAAAYPERWRELTGA